MERKMFGHRIKKKADSARTPGEPYNDAAYDRGHEDEESYKYVKGKDFPMKEKGTSYGRDKDGPPGYEGKEHIKYKDPGYSPHNIQIPEDEPHMKSHVSSDEEHEMEDNYHMSVPDQTKYALEKHLKRARMHMDAPDQEDVKPLRGNIVHNVPYSGEKDSSGEELEGPNEMQSAMPKEQRKKMIVAVTRRKMKKERM